MTGEAADWSLNEHLLASIFDALNGANWQRGGGKGNRPAPLPRPGIHDDSKKHYGGAPISLEAARERYAIKESE